MRDIAIKTSSLSALVAALKSLNLGLTYADEPGQDQLVTASHDHALVYHGRVVETPGTYDIEGHEITAPVYHEGEYATLRAVPHISLAVLLADLPEGVEIVPPPAGLPLIGGVWLEPQGPSLEEVKAQALAAINAAMDGALSWLLAGGPASASVLAASAAMMATSDPEGLEMTLDMLTATANMLRTQIATAQTVEQVRAVVIGFAV